MTTRKPHRPSHCTLATVALCLSLLVPALAADQLAVPALQAPGPTPEFSPAQVVRMQLEALRASAETDDGIELAFRFASPNNRRQTGPLRRFAQMIRQGRYRLMLHYREATYYPVEISADQALQRVTLAGTTQTTTFLFVLSRQTDAPYTGCWMTDAVLIEPPETIKV